MKRRRLVVASATFALAIGVPSLARAQFGNDSRSVFLAAVGAATPEIFAGIFAFAGNSHALSGGHGFYRGDMAFTGSFSGADDPLLNDQGGGSGKLIDGVSPFSVIFDPAIATLVHPASGPAYLLFEIFDGWSKGSTAGQPGGGTSNAGGAAGNAEGNGSGNGPAFVSSSDPGGSAGSVGAIGGSPLSLALVQSPLFVTATPEPATLTLMDTGLIGLCGWTMRRKQKAAA